MVVGTAWDPKDQCQRIEDKRIREGAPAIGLAIYRCTYDSDDDWQQFLKVFHHRVTLGFTEEEATHLQQPLDWVIVEDPELDGATILDVRQRFQDWAATQVANDGVWKYCSLARYNYCLYIDKDVIDSIIHPTEISPHYGFDVREAYMKLIEARRFAEVVDDDEDEDEEEEDGEEEEQLSDCHVHISLLSFFPDTDRVLDTETGWDTCYERPPRIAFD